MKKYSSPLRPLLACALLFAPLAPTLDLKAQTPREGGRFPSAQPPQTRRQTPRPQPAPTTTPTGAQTPAAEQQEEDDEVVRVTTNLVQVDVTVVDKDGRQVTDMRPEEFEISVDGKRQTITHFSYISTVASAAQPSATTAPAPARRTEARAPASVPPVRLRPEQVRRTFAFLIDDLALSPESVAFTKRALKKFIDEQMQPNDLAAVVRTSAGVGAFQQFTSDRRQLHAAVDRVRWYHFSRCSDFSEKEGDMETPKESSEGPNRSGLSTEKQDRLMSRAYGTLGALSNVVGGLRQLPGRKSVVMVSDCFQLIDFEGMLTGTAVVDSDRIMQSVRALVDRANRASVVINTLDPRGVQPLGFTAADGPLGGVSLGGGRPFPGTVQRGRSSAYAQKSDREFQERTGIVHLARQTGGLAILNSNDIAASFGRVAEDQKGYYLIGYRPDDETFERTKDGRAQFRRFSVEVKRSGVRARTRTGFFGMTDAEARPAPRTRDEQLKAALFSPFAAGQIDVRLTSLFGNDAASGSYLRSLLHVDARPLTFTKDTDGRHKAVLDIVAVTFDADDRVVEQTNGTETLRLTDEGLERLRRRGLDYVINVPVRQPGPYHLRIAVRDAESERLGSATQFVEVPDLKKERLALSGVALSGAPSEASTSVRASAAPEADEREGGPTTRRMRRGDVLNYGFIIFNARPDKQTGSPRLTTRVRIFRDGRPFFEGTERPFDPTGQADPTRLVAGGSIQIAADMPPGEYVLQVVVTDQLADAKRGSVTQWADFEVVK